MCKNIKVKQLYSMAGYDHTHHVVIGILHNGLLYFGFLLLKLPNLLTCFNREC